jgi:hypothetical protein
MSAAQPPDDANPKPSPHNPTAARVALYNIPSTGISGYPELETCLQHRNNILASPKIIHLFQSIQQLTPSSALIPAALIQCVDCPPGIEAATSTETPTGRPGELQTLIGICQNRKKAASLPRIQSDVAHELIHLYDATRYELDGQDCRQVLCTETRSAMLSGQCHLAPKHRINSFALASLHVTAHQLENGFAQCVRQRAVTSTAKLAQCRLFGTTSPGVVDDTIQVCMRDTSPFEVVP